MINKSVSIIIPVYNEKDLINDCVDKVLKVLRKEFSDFELILIDDGSLDGTRETLRQVALKDPRIKFYENNINLNVGISVQRGMVLATKEIVVHNSIDLPLSPEDIPKLVDQMDDCDVLVIERDSYPSYTKWRRICSYVNILLNKIIFSSNFDDLNFTQIYRKEIIQLILPMAKSPAFTTPEMVYNAERLGLKVKKVKWKYEPRIKGTGAFGRPHDILWCLYDMCRYRLRMKGNRRKVVAECQSLDLA